MTRPLENDEEEVQMEMKGFARRDGELANAEEDESKKMSLFASFMASFRRSKHTEAD